MADVNDSKSKEKKKGMPNTFATMVIALTAVAVLSGTALGVTNLITADRIEANQLERRMGAVFDALDKLPEQYKNDPDADQWDDWHKCEAVQEDERAGFAVYPAFDQPQDGELIGAAVRAKVGSGYSGEISAVVGFTSDGAITEVSVLEHAETPGLGAKITEGEFTDQFRDIRPSSKPPRLTQYGGQIDGITAATISSEAMTELVEVASEAFEDYIQQRENQGGPDE